MLKIKSPQSVTELPGFAEGLFSVQDVTASQPLRLLGPQPAQTILDLCAAPGIKTTQLAELTGDKALILATDIDSQRLKKVRENTARLGTSSVRIVAYEELEQKVAEIGLFDAVLLDLIMPGLSGQQVYYKLPKRLQRRVVFVTGDTGNPATRQFLAATGQPALFKPVDLDELLRMLQSVTAG